jgi:hypothetical protein
MPALRSPRSAILVGVAVALDTPLPTAAGRVLLGAGLGVVR